MHFKLRAQLLDYFSTHEEIYNLWTPWHGEQIGQPNTQALWLPSNNWQMEYRVWTASITTVVLVQETVFRGEIMMS
jgi:hypothetical protein